MSKYINPKPRVFALFLGGGVGWFRLFRVPKLGMTVFRASSRASRGLLGLSSNGVSKSTEPESTLQGRFKINYERVSVITFHIFH